MSWPVLSRRWNVRWTDHWGGHVGELFYNRDDAMARYAALRAQGVRSASVWACTELTWERRL